ncbi:MAG: class I SAM-dependent methyltransferase, partial [Bryobacteraceae bacterium]|nr:class I SAM-dependent methyltransferase [Bryobacteraceae bacterium]
EAFFWSKIAGWMVEDAINRRPAELKEHFNILDLGCGFGTLLVFSTIIYGAPGTCVDLASTLYPNVSEAYDVSFIKGDIEAGELPVLANTQVMIMTEVLEHFNFAPVPILRKIGDLLAPGGSFFLSTPDADGRWGRTYKYHRALNDFPAFDGGRKRVDDHLWHYNEGELRAVLTQAGFKIKRLDRTMNRGFTHFNVWATK